MMGVKEFTNDRGNAFTVVVQESDGHWGTTPGETVVKFYDAEYAGKDGFTEHGQFASEYYLRTLLDHDQEYGLNLHGGVPKWSIDAETMAEITKFILVFS